MKTTTTIAITLLFCGQLQAHDPSDPEHAHPHVHAPRFQQAQPPPGPVATAAKATPAQAAPFAKFDPAVKTRWDDRFLYIEGNGLPAHNMMVGITAWQQQVPLPQAYTGANAWRIPRFPVPAEEPVSVRDRFLRGAIAIAANGIPIFNPQNNRGELSAEIGELDQWGGHCGRADDYHYHAAPLHLQTVLGAELPIAYALDGYPIYGLTEPDGSEPKGLDACNGHTTPELGYHYHASKEYPFVIGGFHGKVTEVDGQVDPQPRAQPVRPSLPALRGARITGFATSADGKERKLTYQIAGKDAFVDFAEAGGGTWKFVYTDPDGSKREETYRTGERGGRGEGNRPRRDDRPPGNPQPGDGHAKQGAATSPEIDALKKPVAGFSLSSPDIPDPARYPIEFTGDGAGASPSLAWNGAPAGTAGFALIMDHLTPDDTIKTNWVLWDIPANTTGLPKATKGTGRAGAGSRGSLGYDPPRSQGAGEKTYVITLYALSSAAAPSEPAEKVTREALMASMKGKILGSASLPVTYARDGGARSGDKRPLRAREIASEGPAPVIKPEMTDTMKLNVYADNWFMLYVNGRLVAVDPIQFTPHNVVGIDFLPEYPMTIAVLAKDNADPQTGLEYGSNIGDGGFCLKFADGTVTNSTWKAKSFFHGPINRNTANPKVKQETLPANWWAVDFEDSTWKNAREFSVEEVNPKQPFFDNDFKGAKFIWSDDIALDNTVIFRAKVEKPGWTPRWNTKPDLDVNGVDQR
ncbi:MAG: YHYH protein [Luteolibacter sp.]